MPQGPVIASTQDLNAKLSDLRAKASDLKLRASDLEVRKNQLGEQRRRLGADVAPGAIDKQLADAEHELASTRIQLESMNEQIGDLETERDMARAFNMAPPPGGHIAMTAPPPDALTANRVELERGAAIGGFLLLVPFVIAYARRIWHRSGPQHVNVEDSPRLQRMEQAIESIALEVERIGEAQRFTTKLLADRQPDAVARMGISRKEPGTITPH
ncbi:MAG TPA: hypothetical protein VKA54_17870 [Gemmatimonadaceae bacterium]|nr:hypothetical protein [Gemmatimonadaceae bacterium]